MDENKEIMETAEAEEMESPVEQKETYVPRPKWQIIAAWIGAGIVVAGFLLWCWQIATAGGI